MRVLTTIGVHGLRKPCSLLSWNVVPNAWHVSQRLAGEGNAHFHVGDGGILLEQLVLRQVLVLRVPINQRSTGVRIHGTSKQKCLRCLEDLFVKISDDLL